MNGFPAVCALVLATMVPRQILAAPQAGQASALRIVVLEGEDGVNIIQQKTAVAPVIEVRDRNNQPVAGAVVRFAITRGRATFNGARALTVTTNAAGRAVATGLTPTGSGALQISAAAAFQGQTAVATIAQTNVMTAAASGAGASGGGAASGSAAAGGSGGGLSATTIGIVGGAVAGGTLVATQILGAPSVVYRGTYAGIMVPVFSGPSANCSWTEEHSGTIQLELDVADDGKVSGTGSVSGTLNFVQLKNCQPVGGATQTHGADGPVQGTKDHFTFTSSHPGNVGTNWTYDISGAFNGADIAGTFTLTVRGPNFMDDGVFPITLQKQ